MPTDTIHLTAHETLTIERSIPEVLSMQARWTPGDQEPLEHLHPAQDERFEVLEGALQVRVSGATRVYGAGESFEVPRGTVHTMGPAGDSTARARWEVRPALRTEQMFRDIEAAGIAAGGRPGPLVMAPLLATYRDEFRLGRVPEPVQGILVAVLSRVARLGRAPRTGGAATA
jgi:mannose-6-phosphate isomerase-like protein (cupin superfamily)